MPILVKGVSQRSDNVASVYNNSRRVGGEGYTIEDAPFNPKNEKHKKELDKRKAIVDALENGQKSEGDIQAFLSNRHFSFTTMTTVGEVSATGSSGDGETTKKKATRAAAAK